MEFTVVPHVGALPIKFEMGRDETARIIGPPKRFRVNEQNELEEFRWSGKAPWMPLHVFYDKAGDTILEIEFGKNSVVKYKGIDLFNDKDVIRRLAAEDKPKSILGIIFFPKLGIATSGFDDEGNDKTVTIFQAGRRDQFLADAVDVEL